MTKEINVALLEMIQDVLPQPSMRNDKKLLDLLARVEKYLSV